MISFFTTLTVVIVGKKGDFMLNKFILSALLLTTCLQAKVLQHETIPGKQSKVHVISIENGTEFLEFQVYTNATSLLALVVPLSTLSISNDSTEIPIELNDRYPLVIKCSKGPYLPVYIKDGGKASGTVPDGYEGPYFVSMWLPYPHVPESSKIHIRYVVKQGKTGKIGIKIGSKGDYRLVALQDIKFLQDGLG